MELNIFLEAVIARAGPISPFVHRQNSETVARGRQSAFDIAVILEREEFHRSEYRSFLVAQHALALACGEYDTPRSLLASLIDLEKVLDDSIAAHVQ